MEQKIISLLRANPRGLTAKVIASTLNTDRSTVNQLLYGKLNRLCYVDSSYVWRLINQEPEERLNNTNQATTISADPELKKICQYYLNCIALDGTNKVSAFKDSQFTPDYVEVDSLNLNAQNSEEVINFMTNTARMSRKVMYLGYPLCVYTIHGRNGDFKRLAPVFLFQVTYDAGSCSVTSIPTINMEIIKQYCSRDENEQLHEMIRLEEELGLNNSDSEFDISDLVTRLYYIRRWNWQEEMDPESFNLTPMSMISYDGIYNKAVLIRADASLYTQGLEHELLELSKLSKEQYRQTALYDWVHNNERHEIEESNESIRLLEVLPLNTEQSNAIETSLSQNLTVITGPPGTGKSQVVTNLIVNLAWKGKKAIFSSKNNKAVDVVEKRVNGLTNRPIMLRMGNNQGADAIVTFLTDVLTHAPAQRTDKDEYEEIKSIYDNLQLRIGQLNQDKKDFVATRNELDLLEQNICPFRKNWAKFIVSINKDDVLELENALQQSSLFFDKTQKSQQNVFVKMFWSFLSKSRIETYRTSIDRLNKCLNKYGYAAIDCSLSDSKEAVFSSTLKVLEEMKAIVKYNELLSKLGRLEPLEEIDKQLLEVKREQSEMAHQLWSQWVKVFGLNIPHTLRSLVSQYIATIRLSDGDSNPANGDMGLKNIQNKLREILPICAVTSLSVKSRIPLIAGMYDMLIIDEASQCDIPSILPLLYRCKSSVIIGDPKQLSHITGLSNQQDRNLLTRHEVNAKWSYNAISLYDYAASICHPINIIQLKDHHRCHGEIIEFSNKEFYQGTLRVATNYNRLRKENQLGVRWIDIKGNTCRPHSGSAYNEKEVNCIIEQLKHLVANNYRGSIGVVTPFKAQSERINRTLEKETYLYNSLLSNNHFLADTVHKFQGDERDLIIFSTVISSGVLPGAISFLKNTGNLFNVAITRAKSTLIIVGDEESCLHSGVSYLEHFVAYVRKSEKNTFTSIDPTKDYGLEYPTLDSRFLVSEWEKILYTALYKSGIKTHPQYSIDKYYLDLALFHNGKCLDIEVDGERYHRSWNGELCYRDQLRNQRLFELGWDVKRFWVYEIRDNLPWCIEQIKAWMNKV